MTQVKYRPDFGERREGASVQQRFFSAPDCGSNAFPQLGRITSYTGACGIIANRFAALVYTQA